MSRSESIRFSAGATTLVGSLRLPLSPVDGVPVARWPVVALLPSFLPRQRSGAYDRRGHQAWFGPAGPRSGLLARLGTRLARHGVASFSWDQRGCGWSGGDWASVDLFTLVDDARDALAMLRGRPDLDPARVGLVGHGLGALLALSVGAADPAVGPLTLVGAPARPLADVLRRAAATRSRRARRGGPGERRHPLVEAMDRGLEELIERAERGEPAMTLPLRSGARERIGLRLWEQAFKAPGRALATLQRRSVTVVHAELDEWVDPAESRLLVAALREVPAAPRRWLVPGAGHDLAETGAGFLDSVAADLAARLLPRSLPSVLLSITAEPPAAIR